MSSPVYSTRFMELEGSTGTVTYTVPDGYTAVVRDVDSYVNADLSGAINTYFKGAKGQNIDWWTCDVDTTIVHQWRGRQVLFAGDTFQIVSDGPADVTVSGYLLTNP